MKTKIIFFATLVLMAIQGWAAPVDLSMAQSIAQSFANANSSFRAPSGRVELKLAHAEPSSKLKNQPVFYVFNTTSGFVIVSGDDRANAILAYGDGKFDINNIPDGMRDLLGIYKEDIEYLQTNPKLKVEKISQENPSLMASAGTYLISTNWGQGSPYNNHCPSINDTVCKTGCGATAMAQIVNYWQYPTTLPALSKYTTSTSGIVVEALSKRTLTWSLSSDNRAWLMRYLGQSVSMDYGTKASAGGTVDVARTALVSKFGYSSSASAISKSDYTDAQWKTKLKNEIIANRPVYYVASRKNEEGKYPSHAFVVDGYDSSGNYHINWGWTGSYNGYFALNAFDPDGNRNYTYFQTMIVGLRPNTTVTTSPSSVTFSNKTTGKTYTTTVTVTGVYLTGTLTLKLSGATGVFSIDKTSITKSAATNGATVTVTYKPTAAGTQSATLTISGGGLTSNKTVSIKGTAVTRTITPSVTSLSFGTTAVNKSVQKTLTVKGTNLTGSLTLSTNSSYFTVSPTTITAADAKAGKTVTVTYKPTAAGTHSATLTIKGGDADNKTVSLSGKCAVITPSVTSLNFGTTAKSKAVSKTFTVKGTNLTGSLTLSSSNSSIFTVSPTTITAADAKAGKTVTVTYKPTAAGTHSATLTIKGGSAANKTVSLSGKCAEITTNTSSLVFGGYRDSRTLKVTGTNLTGSLTLTTSNSYFTVSPTTITAAKAASGVTVTVKCNAATNVQHATGKLTISGGSATSKIVTLTLDATAPQPYAGLILPDEEEQEDELNVGKLEVSQNGWNTATTSMNDLIMDVKIYAQGGDIVIETPVEQSAVISDIAGRTRRVNLQAGRNVIPSNSNGVHIVHVGEKTAKLMLK